MPKFGAARVSVSANRNIAVWWLGLGIVAIAAALRLYHIGAQPLWVDEGFSWWDARQSFANLWNLVPQCDPHPPLYFLTLKFWIDGFGDSAGAMRSLSALLGIATTVVVMLAGREINARVGWLAGLLFALTPFEVDYGREARPYALLAFGAALALYAVLRLSRALREKRLADPKSDVARDQRVESSTWLLLIFSCAALLWTNDAAALTVVSLSVALGCLILFDREARSLFKPLAIVAVIVAVLWLPYLPKLLDQTNGVISDFWIPPPTAWSIKDTLRMLVSLNSTNAFWWAIGLLAAGLALMWHRGLWREALLLGGLIVLPIVLNYFVSATVKSIFLSRTMIGVTPAIVVTIAAAAMLIRSPTIRSSTCVLLVAAHALALYNWRSQDDGNEPWDRIASEVVTASPHSRDQADAIVLLASNQEALPFSHALEDLHQSMPLQGAPVNFPAPGLQARYPSGKCAPSLLGQDLSPLAAKINRYSVVYFITRTNNVYDPGDRVVKFLQSLGFKQSFVDKFTPGALEVHKLVRQVLQIPSSFQPAAQNATSIMPIHPLVRRKHPVRKSA